MSNTSSRLFAFTALVSTATGVFMAYRAYDPPPPKPAPLVEPIAWTRTLLVFSRHNCSPCAKLKRWSLYSARVKRALAGAKVQEIDTTADPAAAARYRVESTPTLVYVARDPAGREQELARHEGYLDAASLAAFLRAAPKPKPPS